MQNELEQARSEMDAIDKEMAALFERRMDAAARIADYKKRHHMKVADPSRELVVAETNTARIQDPALVEYYKQFLLGLMAISRLYQQQLMGEERGA